MNGVLSQSGSNAKHRLAILGNPENRRVVGFQDAVEAMDGLRPRCVSWLEILKSPKHGIARLRDATRVRIDSPGENSQVVDRLIQRGGGAGELLHGEIAYLREQHNGFVAVLGQLANTSLPFMNSPADVARMFDKWASHKRFVDAGLPRPQTKLAPDNLSGFAHFRAEFGAVSSGRIFLKPRYASSASGVCALRWSGDRMQLIAPIALRRETPNKVRLFNSLRIRQYTSLTDVELILESLLRQGMIMEKWIPKAKLPDGQFDLRILVVAGKARHIVVRQSDHPMTNLHLGNRRGSLQEVVEHLGPQCIRSCKALAVGAVSCFPDSLYAGVDIIVSSSGDPTVCEINAFGDLLPDLISEGETTEEAIWRASHANYDCV